MSFEMVLVYGQLQRRYANMEKNTAEMENSEIYWVELTLNFFSWIILGLTIILLAKHHGCISSAIN